MHLTSQDPSQNDKSQKYKRLKLLGVGQFGHVYQVVDAQNNVFALKEFDFKSMPLTEKQKKSISVEIQIMSEIKHPRILHLYDQIQTPKGLGIVTTFCDGGDLETCLIDNSRGRGFGEQKALALLREIGEAFFVLRSRRIIHRDLKLANIFLKEGHVVVGDFGFAKVGVSSTESKLGTPYYMAPEILFGQQKYYDSRCDLWSIGVCFYLLIYGQLPFDAKNITELISKIDRTSGDRLRFPKHHEVSSQTRRVLMKLLQKLPQDRMKFSEFFQFCGIQLTDNDINQLNSSQSQYEVSENDNSLRESQMSNFVGMQGLGQEPEINQQGQTGAFSQMANQVSVGNRAPGQQQIGGMVVKPANLDLLNSADSLKAYPSLIGDSRYGFFLLANEADSRMILPYLNEVNKMILNMRTIHATAELRGTKSTVILQGEVNVACLLLEIFAARRTELITAELAGLMASKANVFKIDNFAQVITSRVYEDLYGSLNLFRQQTNQLYAYQRAKFQADNPTFANDFQIYREMPLPNVESASKKLTLKLIESYKAEYGKYAEPGRTLFAKMIIHCCYFSRLLQLPNFTESPREWVQFYASIDQLTFDKMHSFLMTFKGK